MQEVNNFQLLFPVRKINTIEVFDWCGEVLPKKMIRRILTQNLKTVGERRHRYFE
jgi:hypothetical protein